MVKAAGKKLSRIMNKLFSLLATVVFLSSCSMQHAIQKKAKKHLLNDPALAHAHVGIAIHDPSTNKYTFQHQADKLFVPASNVKIVTAYAALKNLPDFLPSAVWTELDTAILITPMGDPSFLHPDFKKHPLFDRLKLASKPLYMRNDNWNTPAIGNGWSTDDYNEDYQAERNAFPVYGNLIQWFQERSIKENPTTPQDTIDIFIYSNPEINWSVDFGKSSNNFQVKRKEHENFFVLSEGKEKSAIQAVPFITNGLLSGLILLKDSLGKAVQIADEELIQYSKGQSGIIIHSQHRDSLLQKMMYRSDNFYADQSLLMISQLLLSRIDEAAIIQELLKKDLSQLPVKPRWTDGSGLSRYNQFSPSDMIVVLNQLKAEQDWQKIKTIFPKAGQGTLRAISDKREEFIYAKSGSMSGIYCLSGYVFTKKGKWMNFSIMVNNHDSNTSTVRKKVEAFLQSL
jgi:D-alanyl-D-alanine carboxypeptidase/D-alanyl-D-alanine-endopeptidase (penicillin-binding protein 4)